MPEVETELQSVIRLSKDLAIATASLSTREVRYLVDAYYTMQDNRIRASAQIRSMDESNEPHDVLQWLFGQAQTLENQIKRALDKWTDTQHMGRWAKCAPPGSMVQVTSGRWGGASAPIESLVDGQSIAAFDRRRARLTQRPIRVAENLFQGDLIGVGVGSQFTEVTPAHKWLVKLTAPEELRLVYMMRKNRKYRVGQCTALWDSQRGNGRFHLRRRAMQEGADGAWILKLCVTPQEATIYENWVSVQFGLPMMVFGEPTGSGKGRLTQSGIDDFYSRLDNESQRNRAMACLDYHNLIEDLPIPVVKTNGKKEFVSCLVVHAVNLTPGMMEVPLPIRGGGIEWKPIEALNKRAYEGPVYSLDVAEEHKYVQDGMVTCNSIVGIGPVISAGLLAHIDITKAPTVGHIWRFAGLDPTLVWEKKQKRPFNAGLKTLCAFKLGESFVKVQNHDDDIYGKIYVKRKALEQERNDAGLLKDQAEKTLARFKIDKKTEAYKAYAQGKLPPAQIHARARRYAVKLFLSHYHAEAYRNHFGKEPPLPYPVAMLGHAHVILPPDIE